MDEQNEKIPTWTGRAVSTAEVASSDLEMASKGPAAWQRPDEGQNLDDDELGDDSRGAVSNTDSSQSQPDLERAKPWIVVAAGLTIIVLGAIYTMSRDTASDEVLEADSGLSATSGGAVSTNVESLPPSAGAGSEPLSPDTNETGDSAISESTEFGDQAKASSRLDAATRARYSARAATYGETAWALYDNGVIYFEGQVPSEAYAGELKDQVAAIGPGIVETSANYIIDPTAPPPVDPPLFLPQAVRFVDGTTTFTDESQAVVSAAPFAIMSFFSDAHITIVVRPQIDDGGLVQTELAEARASKIVEEWMLMGLDSSQISIDTVTTDIEEGSVEFVVTKLLGT